MIALDQGDPWFWIITGVGTIAVGAILRWVGIAVIDRIVKLLSVEQTKNDERSIVVEQRASVAAERADVAAVHAEELKETIGQKNGQGDLMTIATKILIEQRDMRVGLDQASERLAETARWQVTHDAKDTETRAIVDATATDVTAIKDHLGLE